MGGGCPATVRGVSRCLYIASAGPETGKSAVALGMVDAMSRRVGRVGFFRPVVRAGGTDPLVALVRAQYPAVVADEPAACCGVSYDDLHADRERAVHVIVERFRALERRCDAVLVVGTDYTDVGAPTELAYNGELALNIGAPVLLVIDGRGRAADDLAVATHLAYEVLHERGNEVLGAVVNRVDPARLAGMRAAIERHLHDGPSPEHVQHVDVLPELPLLSAPTFGALLHGCEGSLVLGSPEGLGAEVLDVVVAAMNLPHALEYLHEGSMVITPGDRAELVVGMLAAHYSYTFPRLSGVLLTGGMTLPGSIRRWSRASEPSCRSGSPR